jgi:hypothetical protein
MPENFSSHQTMAVVIDHESVRVLHPLNDVDALVLQACSAEDPATWDDVAMVWPRYKFHPENTEFVDGLPLRQTGLSDAIALLADVSAWFVLDLKQRRVLTGGQFPLLRLRHTPIDEDGPLTHSTVLPPWWELLQHVAPETILGPRSTPLSIPDPHRDILWGSLPCSFFADRMLALIHGGEDWIGKDWEDEPCGRRELTLSVHRDWLMTPRTAVCILGKNGSQTWWTARHFESIGMKPRCPFRKSYRHSNRRRWVDTKWSSTSRPAAKRFKLDGYGCWKTKAESKVVTHRSSWPVRWRIFLRVGK